MDGGFLCARVQGPRENHTSFFTCRDEHTVRISSDDDSFEEDSEDLDSNDIDEEVKEEEKQRLEESEQQCEHKKKRVADWSDDDD